MTKLIIKDPGLTLDIPGSATVRSPVEIDISNLDVAVIISYLKKVGVDKFEIKHCPNNNVVLKDIKESLPKNISDNIIFRKELNDIKSLLKELVDYKPNINIIPCELRKIKKDDDFIPSVNLDKLELKSKDDDLNE